MGGWSRTSGRTLAPSPFDPALWRRLLALAHPDRAGDHDLFVWVQGLREYVAGEALDPPIHERPRRTPASDNPRVPFEEGADHDVLVRRALDLAGTIPSAYARLLLFLEDCHASHHGRLLAEQGRGSSYKRLAAIGHACGFDQEARTTFYRIAESVPLSDRMAAHMLDALKGGL